MGFCMHIEGVTCDNCRDALNPFLIGSSPIPTAVEWFGVTEYLDPFRAGAAIAFGLMGMAEAIRRRPRYQWRATVGMSPNSQNYAVSWHSSEELATAHIRELTRRGGYGPSTVTKEEIEWCVECDGDGRRP